MPEDVLSYVRDRKPEFKDVPDSDLMAYLKDRHPDILAAAGKLGQTNQQRVSRQRLADLQSQTGQAQAAQDTTNAKTQFAGTIAASLPAVAAAPFTAGASLAPALAISAGAGLAGGALREGVKTLGGSSEIPRSGAGLAKTLALDTVLGAAGEGLGRGIAAVSKTLVPRLIQRAAAQTEAGANTLEVAATQGRQSLYDMAQQAGNPAVNVGGALTKAYQRLIDLPKGTGPFGARYGGLPAKGAELLKTIEDQLNLAGGTAATHQPLDALIRIKGDISQLAWKEPGLGFEVRQIAKDLAGDLDKALRPALKAAGGDEAVALFNNVNQLQKTQKANSLALSAAEKALKGLGTTAVGAAAGGAYGASRERSIGGALKGAAEGAAIGAGIGLTRNAAAWAVQAALNNPAAVGLAKRAISLAAEGKDGPASVLMGRAFAAAGIREHLKDYLKGQAAPEE